MGKLSIVATPIGNLEDITLRALRTLKDCDVIYAEDTRVTAKLLTRYEIKKPVLRLDAVTELKKAGEIITRLENDEHIAFVSDAGTPCISDPGQRLVAAVRSREALGEVGRDIQIEAIPGPSALTAALSIAGIDVTKFTFLGFLPHKKGRQTALKKITESELPVVLYESPHRILKLLEECVQHRVSDIVIARELTKIHEEVISGTPSEVQKHFVEHPDTVKGEFVVIVEP
ncbi:MAG: 16S rRNA (cytidine(1402)-2'-O)-methyltransferase [Candidatus Kaiserbacteria bacterium]|nr:16S rRNA (cytidine(1402)-2'-O)-methyltransferase [Candidatus Kaiserbacteria bacterium]